MRESVELDENGRNALRAEFDSFADEYVSQHRANIAITGEEPEYFSEYKIADLSRFVSRVKARADRVLDFGSGIGNSLPFFRKYFAHSSVSCADVSERSMTISRTRFPGPETYIIIGDVIPLESESQDIVFSACVFHHIPHDLHAHWLNELHRVTRPGGVLAIYEHNPLNPLTVNAVNTCPFDVNAHLLRAGTLRRRAAEGGWEKARVDYKLFFPSLLRGLRPMEGYLGWLPLGAQYRMTAWRTT